MLQNLIELLPIFVPINYSYQFLGVLTATWQAG